MKITNIILAAILLIQLGILVFKPSSGPSFTIKTVKVYNDLKSKDVKTIVVSSRENKSSITLSQQGKKWVIKEAFNYEADKSRIDDILSIIPLLSKAKIASENKSMFSSYNLGDDNYNYNLVLKDAKNKVLVDILVGKSVIKSSFIRKKGGNTVYALGSSISGAYFDTPTEYMSSTTLTLPDSKERTDIALNYKGQELKFVESTPGGPTMGANGQMEMKEAVWGVLGADGKVETSADATKVKEIISSLGSIMFDTVEGVKSSGKYGFNNPLITITINTKTKSKKTIVKVGNLIGKTKKRYLSISSSEFVFGIDEFKYKTWMAERKNLVSSPNKVDNFGKDGKLPEMKLPNNKLKLNVPGMPDKKHVKDAVIHPAPVPVPAPATK